MTPVAKTGKKLTRADLVQKLQDKSFSRRLAVDMVNLLFEEIAAALVRGEDVEFPFGSLKRVKRDRKPKRGFFLNKIMVMYKNPWTVELEISDAGRKLLDECDRLVEEEQRREIARRQVIWRW